MISWALSSESLPGWALVWLGALTVAAELFADNGQPLPTAECAVACQGAVERVTHDECLCSPACAQR